jgi:hypothetical protein
MKILTTAMLTIGSELIVPFVAVGLAPWATPSSRSLPWAAFFSAIAFCAVFLVLLGLRLADPKLLAVVALIGVFFAVFVWFVFDDASQVQYERSSNREMLVRVSATLFSLEGLLFLLGFAATVFLPLGGAALIMRNRRVA